MNRPTVTVETIDATLTTVEVCRVLKRSRAQFYRARKQLRAIGVLVEQLPRTDRRVRYLGAPIARFLSADGQADQLRHAMRLAG